MFQKSCGVLRKFQFSLLLLLFVFALTVLPGCQTKFAEKPPIQNPPAPSSAPQAPVVVDGIRTSYADIVARVAPAVVKINISTKSRPQQQGFSLEDFFNGNPHSPRQNNRPQRGLGSGVIVSPDGKILTNQHVVDGADIIKVELNDKKSYTAKVIGSDQPSDLAVLQIQAENLPFLNFSNSDEVRVGDIVLAIGNPLGVGQSVTEGIISAKGRRTGISDGSYEDFLQTDAPINQGNSGGALVNLQGELIGVPSQILSTSGGSIGIGFAIPSNMAKSVMEQLVKDGKVRRGMLGVGIQNVTEDLAKSLDLKEANGVLVNQITKNSAAEKAGIKSGDIILALNSEKIEDSNMLRNRVAATAPGTEITVLINRSGNEQELKVTLGEFNQEVAQRKMDSPETQQSESNKNSKLGLTLQPITPEIAQRLNLDGELRGLLVTNVEQNSPAEEEGITRGDVILEINRQNVTTVEEAQSAVEKSGDKPILLLISRRSQTVFLTISPQQ